MTNGIERFSHHEPCPRCGSRNNLGVWDNGHKFCFGCKYYVPSPDSIEQLRKRLTMAENTNNNGNVASIDSSSFTGVIPKKALGWLRTYGITDSEILHHGILWNTARDSLVFGIRDQHGIVLTNERYFGTNPNAPKYWTTGSKETNNIYLLNSLTPNCLIFVEDYVSAIKVSRFANCLPLFGSQIPANALKWASERFKCLRVWLDMDKATESLKQASKLSQWVSNTRSIITELDPKEYSNNELIKILKDYKVLA